MLFKILESGPELNLRRLLELAKVRCFRDILLDITLLLWNVMMSGLDAWLPFKRCLKGIFIAADTV